MDLPLMIPSIMMRGTALRSATYGRPAITYTLLREIMGAEKFKEALRNYIDAWSGKHPLPYDFFFLFNELHGGSLNWFWKAWFFERGYPDLAIGNVSSTANRTEVTIEKIGNLPVPVHLSAFFADSTEQQISESAAIWKDGKSSFKMHFEHQAGLQRIELGTNHIPDRDKNNNTYQIEGQKDQ